MTLSSILPVSPPAALGALAELFHGALLSPENAAGRRTVPWARGEAVAYRPDAWKYPCNGLTSRLPALSAAMASATAAAPASVV